MVVRRSWGDQDPLLRAGGRRVMQAWRRDCLGPVNLRAPLAPSIGRSAAGDRRTECFRSEISRAGLAIGLAASFAPLPLAPAHGSANPRRVARLPFAAPP